MTVSAGWRTRLELNVCKNFEMQKTWSSWVILLEIIFTVSWFHQRDQFFLSYVFKAQFLLMKLIIKLKHLEIIYASFKNVYYDSTVRQVVQDYNQRRTRCGCFLIKIKSDIYLCSSFKNVNLVSLFYFSQEKMKPYSIKISISLNSNFKSTDGRINIILEYSIVVGKSGIKTTIIVTRNIALALVDIPIHKSTIQRDK